MDWFWLGLDKLHYYPLLSHGIPIGPLKALYPAIPDLATRSSDMVAVSAGFGQPARMHCGLEVIGHREA